MRGTGGALIDEVERSGLRGRGGGGLPHRAQAARGRRRRGPAVVVANGTEGEPASRKDAVLLARDPDLVIDGALAAAGAVRRARGRSSPSRAAPTALARGRARRCADARRRPLPVRLSVAGHAGALRRRRGERARPLAQRRARRRPPLTPPRPSERGVGGRPTLVQNVETLAHIALIARHGADWFCAPRDRRRARARCSSTSAGRCARPGVHEIALGTPLGEVLAAPAGPPTASPACWWAATSAPGCGRTTRWAVPSRAAGLRPAGASLGSRHRRRCCRGRPAGWCETARVVALPGARERRPVRALRVRPARAGRRVRRARRRPRRRRGAAGDARSCPARSRGAAPAPTPTAPRAWRAARWRRSRDEVDLHLQGRCSATRGPPVLPVPAHPDEWR